MKILFINPPFLSEVGKFSREQRSPAVTKSGTFYYPMWLCYTAGALEKDGHEITLIDAPAKRMNSNDIIQKVKNYRYDIVVIDTSTPSIYNDYQFCLKLKEYLDAFSVFVGPHVSALPEETLRMGDGIDAVARGEYDYTIKDLAKCIDSNGKYNLTNLKNIEGLSFKWNQKTYHNIERNNNHNLDDLPFVSKIYKKHLNYKDYFYSHSKYPILTIVTGRGCPHKCVYCVYPQVFFGKKVRYRSIKNVIDEIDYIHINFPDIKEIMF